MRPRVLGGQGGSAPARHLPGLLLDDTLLLEWLVKAGVTVLYLDDNLKAINDGDRVR